MCLATAKHELKVCLWNVVFQGLCHDVPQRGLPTMRHNEVCNLTAPLLPETCSDVSIEPTMQNLNGEEFGSRSNNCEDEPRLDI